MSKLFEPVLGFLFLVIPFVFAIVLGFVWSWDFSRVYTGLPHDPFALGAVVFGGIYSLVVAKVVYTWAAVKAKT